MTCPDCGNMIAYNSYFSAFYCPRCGGIFKKVKPMTNADRIRSMSDEELADFLAYTWATSARAWQKDNGETLHWLKQNAE